MIKAVGSSSDLSCLDSTIRATLHMGQWISDVFIAKADMEAQDISSVNRSIPMDDLILGDYGMTEQRHESTGLLEDVANRQQELEISLSEATRILSSITTEQSKILETLSALQSSVDHLRDSVNTLSATNIGSGNFEVESFGNSQHTRQMSTSVPASLIRGIWYHNNPQTPAPVSFAYLKKLCDAAMGKYPDSCKRKMGASLGKYIDLIDTDNQVHSSILIISECLFGKT
jgi:hypothetical protein